MYQKMYLHNVVKLKIKVTHSIERRPSWEFNIHSSSKGIPNILWNLKIQYYDPKRPLFFSLLNKMNLVQI
jgi:hypothetical protein